MSNTEVSILSFAVEKSIPISTVLKLVESSKFLAKDTKALEGVKMNRTSATYKLKDSLATNNHIKPVEKLRQYLFSVNMDECTSRNNKKVFSILVSFYDGEKQRSVVEHH